MNILIVNIEYNVSFILVHYTWWNSFINVHFFHKIDNKKRFFQLWAIRKFPWTKYLHKYNVKMIMNFCLIIIFLPVYGIDVITLVTIEWEARKTPKKFERSNFKKVGNWTPKKFSKPQDCPWTLENMPNLSGGYNIGSTCKWETMMWFYLVSYFEQCSPCVAS